jgi:hypothetical protein
MGDYDTSVTILRGKQVSFKQIFSSETLIISFHVSFFLRISNPELQNQRQQSMLPGIGQRTPLASIFLVLFH